MRLLEPCKQPQGLLSLYDAFDLALQNNPQTRGSWEYAKAVAADYGLAKTAYLPTGSVSIGTFRQDNQYNQFSGMSSFGSNIGGSQTIRYAQLEINYLLFNFGGREAQLSAAKQALYAANFNYNQVLQDVALSVETAYFNLNAAKATFIARIADVEDAQATFDSAQTKFEAGLADKQELLQAQAEYEAARYHLEQAYADMQNKRAILAQAIGVPISDTVDIGLPQKELLPVDIEASVSELMAAALQQRPILLAAHAQWQVAHAQEKAARSDMLPYLNASYSQTRSSGVGQSLQPTDQSMAYIAVQWDVFDLFQDNYSRLKAKALAKAACAQLKQAQLKVMSEIWSFFYAFKSSLKQLEFSKAYLEAAQEAFCATTLGYRTGIKSMTDLLRAQDTLAQARVQYIQTQSTIAITLAHLAHATGRMDYELAQPSDFYTHGTPSILSRT